MKLGMILFILAMAIKGFAAVAADDSESAWKSFEGTETMSSPAVSTPSPMQFLISPYGIERRFEAATNPVMEAREPISVAVGLRIYRHLVSLEYSRFSESSGNETFHVSRKFQDLLGWYRYAFYKNQSFRATVGGGLGFYQENISTSFYGVKQELNSGNKWTAATGLGVEYEPIKYLSLFLEGRLITGQNIDPNPNPDVLARVAVQF